MIATDRFSERQNIPERSVLPPVRFSPKPGRKSVRFLKVPEEASRLAWMISLCLSIATFIWRTATSRFPIVPFEMNPAALEECLQLLRKPPNGCRENAGSKPCAIWREEHPTPRQRRKNAETRLALL